jgi:RNA polymerase sigma factor (sigma-70 family)
MTPQETILAFTKHTEATKGIVFKVAALYCTNPEDRKDLVQEIMIQLWKSYHRYSALGSYATWVYRIAFNVAISYKRKSVRQIQPESIEVEQLLGLPESGNEALEEQLRFLQHCIAGLPDIDKALIMLYLDEKNHKEIAEIMGLTLTNVGTRISRIKAKLKQLFFEI